MSSHRAPVGSVHGRPANCEVPCPRTRAIGDTATATSLAAVQDLGPPPACSSWWLGSSGQGSTGWVAAAAGATHLGTYFRAQAWSWVASPFLQSSACSSGRFVPRDAEQDWAPTWTSHLTPAHRSAHRCFWPTTSSGRSPRQGRKLVEAQVAASTGRAATSHRHDRSDRDTGRAAEVCHSISKDPSHY
jgi:hypothetical protein